MWFLLLAFASHKWVISACLGLKWARSAVGGVGGYRSWVPSVGSVSGYRRWVPWVN